MTLLVSWYYEIYCSNINGAMKILRFVWVTAVAGPVHTHGYRLLVALGLCAWLPGQALAHDLQHKIEEGAAVSIKLFFADGNEFSFETYEVYRAGDEAPFQVGRPDIQGRVVFIPDRAGTWRLKAFSEDGHGADLSFTTGGEGGVEGANEPFLERHLRVIVGVSVIFGVFGLVNLFSRGGRRS